jgi:omega-amidase
MKIGLAQFSPSWENKAENKIKINSLLANAAERNDLLIFPEMSLTGFTMKSKDYSENLKGETFDFFASVAVKYNCFIIAGVIETSEDKLFNTALVINPKGELTASYRKIHPFSYSSENKYYDRGNEPVTLNINGWNTGLTICYDLRFPELYRLYGKQKAGLIINIANWPDTRIHHWKTLIKARAIENQCYIAAVNRTGNDPKLNYPGASCLIGPMGAEILMADDGEAVYSGIISSEHLNDIREKFPFLEDIHLI